MGKNTKETCDCLVIGAGASGMMAAITAARLGKKVIIIEHLDKPGKKLLATGNGKCNFTNEFMNKKCFGGDSAFVEQILSSFSLEDCLHFFHSIGIYPKQKNGYFYPNSEQAVSVVNALVQELERFNVKISYETKVNEIFPEEEFCLVSTNKGFFEGKKIIIATGLLAAPKLGSDGSLFEIVKSLGHRFTPILPALCGFYCKGIDFKKVAGVRATGKVSALVDGNVVAEDTGEIQFTDYGLSGIPVFQISRYISKALYEKKPVSIHVNLTPDLNYTELLKELTYRKKICKNHTADFLLNGFINQKLSNEILRKSNIDSSIFVSSLTENDLEAIANYLKNLDIKVTRARDFEFAQVCTGGIPVTDVNWNTLESKFVPNIHFAGEILDVDGICGGYNLHFAWATGYIAGKI